MCLDFIGVLSFERTLRGLLGGVVSKILGIGLWACMAKSPFTAAATSGTISSGLPGSTTSGSGLIVRIWNMV